MRYRILPVGRNSVRSLQHSVALHFLQITEFRHDWIRCLMTAPEDCRPVGIHSVIWNGFWRNRTVYTEGDQWEPVVWISSLAENQVKPYYVKRSCGESNSVIIAVLFRFPLIMSLQTGNQPVRSRLWHGESNLSPRHGYNFQVLSSSRSCTHAAVM